MRMTTNPQQFPVSMRFLHWLMAAMVLTMLGIGVAMVASLADYHLLVSIHRPVGILILILVVIRFVNRRSSTLPPFPATMSSQERFIAHASEMLLYTLLFVQPLVGWGMLSAARYPIVLYGPLHLFPGIAEGAHGSRLPLIPRVHRPFWSCSVSHADPAGSLVQPHGAL
jgi:cytochrome b561